MGLAEIAKEAWEKEQRQRRESVRQRRIELEKVARHQFEDIFGVVPEKCSVRDVEYCDFADLECQGFRFRYWVVPECTTFTLKGECPACGEEVDSEDFSSLAELGKLFKEGFVPASWHEELCKGSK